MMRVEVYRTPGFEESILETAIVYCLVDYDGPGTKNTEPRTLFLRMLP